MSEIDVSDRKDHEESQAAQAASRIRKRAEELKVEFNWIEVKKDRDEGRP